MARHLKILVTTVIMFASTNPQMWSQAELVDVDSCRRLLTIDAHQPFDDGSLALVLQIAVSDASHEKAVGFWDTARVEHAGSSNAVPA